MKTRTGALPNSAGFPGTNMVKPRAHERNYTRSLTSREMIEFYTTGKMPIRIIKETELNKKLYKRFKKK